MTRPGQKHLNPFTFDGELLHGAPLPSAAVRRQAEAADAAACSDAGAQDIVWVQVVAALRTRHVLAFRAVPHPIIPSYAN